jgi:nucleoside phosphorylase
MTRDLLIIVPTRSEIRPLIRHFHFRPVAQPAALAPGAAKDRAGLEVHEGKIGARHCWLVEGGFHRHLEKNIEGLLKDFPAKKVILAGTAGALRPEMKIGDVFLISEVIHEKDGRVLLVPLPQIFSGIKTATVLTGSVLADPRTKKRLLADFPAASLYDMESFYLADICLALKKDFLIIRTVSDMLATPWPPVKLLARHFERLRWPEFIFDLFKDRASCLQLLRLRRYFHQSMKNIAVIMEKALEQ